MTGDTRELVIPPCMKVGRPIFFSVMIMLISFIPVFMLSGREGKLFHPLAFTKSDVHQRQTKARRGQLDRPQLHQHLQAASDLVLTAPV